MKVSKHGYLENGYSTKVKTSRLQRKNRKLLNYLTENFCHINKAASELPINVQIGHYTNTPRDKRYCPLCNRWEVEDEYHIFFKCPHFNEQGKE